MARDRALPTADARTARSIAQGDVVGFVAENGAHVWRGLPYGASTAGENRWRAPKPAPGWAGVREAVAFAERCAQLTNEYDEDEGVKPGLVVGSEDCLTLDVYAPADATGRSLPVMVWIHGGGNVWGRSSLYDGSRLAQNHDVIVVAIQFRIGPLGWFAHAALRDSAERPEDRAAAFTVLDQMAALKWLQENVMAFGGDPNNLTVFGESSGGHDIVALLASPLARGRFQRAIVQSGVFDSTPLGAAEGVSGDLLNPARTVARALGASTADELRAVPVEQLLQAYTRTPGFLDVPRVIEDGVVLPSGPMREAFDSTGTFNAVPIMIGTTRDEMKLFYLRDPRFIRKRWGRFPVPHDQDQWDALTGYLSRMWRIRSVNEPAAQMAAAGHEDVYTYRFDWDEGGRVLFTDFATLLGAAHGFEIPFVFNRFQHLGDADRFLFPKATRGERERLSRTMGELWTSFARDGVPRSDGAPAWPKHGADEGAFLRLDTERDGGIEVVKGADEMSALLEDLEADERIDARLVVEEMDRWMFSKPLAPGVAAELGIDTP